MVVATILGCVGGYRGGGFFGLLLWIFLFCGCGLILGFSYNCWLIMGSGGFAVAVDLIGIGSPFSLFSLASS